MGYTHYFTNVRATAELARLPRDPAASPVALRGWDGTGARSSPRT